MKDVRVIESRHNTTLKAVAALKEAKHRRSTGCFRVEGLTEILNAIQHGFALHQLFSTHHVLPSDLEQKEAWSVDSCQYHLPSSLFQKVSSRENPDGFLAVCKQRPIPDCRPENFKLDGPVLILDQLEKPGNFGAILRSCAAFGFDTLVLNSNALDPYHPYVIRNSRGHCLAMHYYRDTPESTFNSLAHHGYSFFIASPEAELSIEQARFSSNSAIVLGSEHHGVSSFWKAKASQLFSIPTTEAVDSLNVSVSASIVLYEVFKQLRLSC